MRTQPLRLAPHRRARLIAWASCALLWAAGILLGACAPKRRHIAQRYRWLDPRALVAIVCNLVLIRAAEMARLQLGAKRQPRRPLPPPGFRRHAPRSLRRAALGARLRRYFRGDDCQRIARAREALTDLDAFVRKHVLRRAHRRLTRTRPIVSTRPPAQSFISAPFPAPRAADTS